MAIINDSIILNSDSYKFSHFKQYPPGTERVSSYIESRGVTPGVVPAGAEIVFFGLQPFLRYLEQKIDRYDIDDAAQIAKAHGVPFNREGWEYIYRLHGGHLPIEISALPEGIVTSPSTALAQVINTDTKVPWVTSYIETAMLRAVWYGSTVATLSRECKKVIYAWLQKTSDDADGQIMFKLHDFGARGVSSLESAAIGGAAHLVNFMGSDTLSGVLLAAEHYHEPMAAFSIPAAEHSTITSWGERFEVDACRNMLTQFGGAGKIVAVVSDSYDIMNACENIWGGELADLVKTNGATLVVRPDSGDPKTVVREVVECLASKFGSTINTKGYKILPSYLRVIQGDGINYSSIGEILSELAIFGYAADNVAFGMGGGLLQQLNRDTLKFAMKCSAVQVNGGWRDVFKNPVGDPSKASKKGRLAVKHEIGPFGDAYATVPLNDCPDSHNLLKPVWRNGELLVDHTFADIRERAKLPVSSPSRILSVDAA